MITSPWNNADPPTINAPSMPAPPATYNALLTALLVLEAAPAIIKLLPTNAPPVTCKVPSPAMVAVVASIKYTLPVAVVSDSNVFPTTDKLPFTDAL